MSVNSGARRAVAIAVLVTALGVTACGGGDDGGGGAAQGAETFTISFVGPLSGVTADIGTRGADAVQTLVDSTNEAGGVSRADGSKVTLELKRIDDKGTVQGHAQAIRNAARESGAIVGGMLSSPAIAGMDVAESSGIPYNIVGAISATIEEKIASQGMKFVFHSAPTASVRAGADMQSVIDLLKPKHVYVIAQDTDYGKDMVEGAQAHLDENAPGTTMTVEYVPAGTTQYSSQLLKLKNASPKADVIYTLLAGQEMFSFMEQRNASGDETPVYGGSSTASSNIYIETLGKDGADGTLTNSVWLPEMGGELGAKFAEQYEAKTGRAPADVEAQAYDGTLMVIDAIERAESLEPDAIAAAMADSSIEGLRGPNVFDPKTHGTPDLSFVVSQIQDGGFVPVWPEEYAKGPIAK